jgi:hydrogenase nickel incorporation protein HypB
LNEVKLIKIKEEILSDNKNLAHELRTRLEGTSTLLCNIMASPGGGKTSLILQTIEALATKVRIAVIEADLDSTVDSDKIAETGIPAVQIETGGFCHIDAAMAERALSTLDTAHLDLIFLENVGNLVCPAESDTGAHVNVVILSVPEGDDKPLKYPTMFTVADIIVVNKTDYLEIADFDTGLFRRHVGQLNPSVPVIEVSCRTGAGLSEWVSWLENRLGAMNK